MRERSPRSFRGASRDGLIPRANSNERFPASLRYSIQWYGFQRTLYHWLYISEGDSCHRYLPGSQDRSHGNRIENPTPIDRRRNEPHRRTSVPQFIHLSKHQRRPPPRNVSHLHAVSASPSHVFISSKQRSTWEKLALPLRSTFLHGTSRCRLGNVARRHLD